MSISEFTNWIFVGYCTNRKVSRFSAMRRFALWVNTRVTDDFVVFRLDRWLVCVEIELNCSWDVCFGEAASSGQLVMERI